MINARSETVTEKPSFRTAAAKRRALMPAYLESVLSRCLSSVIEHLKSRPETYVGPSPRGG
ncbi:SOS response-associated peptidase family protein [Arthrobacter sp. CP30]